MLFVKYCICVIIAGKLQVLFMYKIYSLVPLTCLGIYYGAKVAGTPTLYTSLGLVCAASFTFLSSYLSNTYIDYLYSDTVVARQDPKNSKNTRYDESGHLINISTLISKLVVQDPNGPLAKRFDVTKTTISIYESDVPNAFACGFSKEDSSIYVSTAIIKKLGSGSNQMKAVLAHEMGHIAGSHIKIKTFFSSVQLLVHTFKDIAWKSFEESKKKEADERERSKDWAYLLAYVGFAAVDLFLLSSVSRQLEYDADKVAAEYGLGKELLSALSKIDNHHSSYGVLNFFSETFSSHPSLVNRERSIKFYEDTKEASYGTYFRELAKFTAFEWSSAFRSK